MTTRFDYQGQDFDVTEVQGRTMTLFDVFIGGDRPAYFLAEIDGGPTWEFYLHGDTATCRTLTSEAVAAAEADHEGRRRIDCLGGFRLKNVVLERLFCARADERTTLRVELDQGSFIIAEIPADSDDMAAGMEFRDAGGKVFRMKAPR